MDNGIYKIENLVTGKVYVGCSKNMSKRWCSHKYMLVNNSHHSIKLQNSWNLHGEGNFEFSVIERFPSEMDRELLFEEEAYYIGQYDSFHNGYNCKESSVGDVYKSDWLLDFNELDENPTCEWKVVIWSCLDKVHLSLTQGEGYHNINSGSYNERYVNEKHFNGFVWEPIFVNSFKSKEEAGVAYDALKPLCSLDLKTICQVTGMVLSGLS